MGNHSNNAQEPTLQSIEQFGRDLIANTEGLPGFITLTSKREPLIIKESFFRGNHRISLRYHYPDKRDQTLRPGKRGVEIPLEAIPVTIAALTQLQEAITAREAEAYEEASHGA